jgi:tight adherence protein C
MPFIIPISVFAFIVFLAVGLYFLLARPQNQVSERLQRLRNANDEAPSIADFDSPVVKIAERVAEPINRILPPSPAEAGKLQRRLIYAGYRSQNSPIIFRAFQLLSLVFFPMTVWGTAILIWGTEASFIFWMLVGVSLGYLGPRVTLDYLVNSRQQRLRWGMADALDLMVVSVEAGLGVNQAMVRVSQELKYAHPEICEEFDLVNTEIRVGREREEALRNLAERTGVEDLRGLCAMLIQADRFGTSISRAIRVYADSLRTKRRQRAEQAAQKAAVKLLFPLAVFLFPTLFIAMIGPAAIQLIDNFMK